MNKSGNHDAAGSSGHSRAADRWPWPVLSWPGRREQVALLLFAMLGVGTAPGADAMGRMLHSTEGTIYRCRVDRVEAKYTGVANYSLWGTCHVFESTNTTKDQWNRHPESTFGNEKLVGEVKWEGKGKYLPQTKTAEETIHVMRRESPRADVKSFVIAGRINATLQCDQDPWLATPRGGCALKYMGGDETGRRWEKELYSSSHTVPASSSLPPERRSELKAQYQRSEAAWKKRTPGADDTRRLNPQVGHSRIGVDKAKDISTARPNAPTIISPVGTVFQGKGVFRIAPSPYLTGTHALVQLNWLNPSADKKRDGLDKYQYEVPLSQIAAVTGMPAPHQYLAPGTWEMRVRINQPKTGDWSLPVRFQVIGNPAASTTDSRNRAGAQTRSTGPAASSTSPPTGNHKSQTPSGITGKPANAPSAFEGRR